MGDEEQTDAKSAGKGTAPPATAPAPEPEPERFTPEQLAAASRRMFGVSSHAVDGALATDGRKTFTEEQAQKLVTEFMGREVT